jgi:hypothetical protein
LEIRQPRLADNIRDHRSLDARARQAMLWLGDLVFQIQFRGAGTLPSYRGVTLRGAFGHVLKQVVCHIHHSDCSRCILRTRCAYPAVFEGVPPPDRTFMRKYPFIPQPFVLRVQLNEPRVVRSDDPYEFGIRLFGPAIEFAPYVVFAVMEMGRRGIGRDRIPFDVISITDGFSRIYRHGAEGNLAMPRPQLVDVISPGTGGRPVELTVQFLTPVRLRIEGSTNREPDLVAVLKAALRRLRVLSHFYGDAEVAPNNTGHLFASAAEAATVDSELRLHEIPRYSTRQRRQMLIEGYVGHAHYMLSDSALLPVLMAGQECHIGKATSFGLGRIACEVTAT